MSVSIQCYFIKITDSYIYICNVIIILPSQEAWCKTTESFLYDSYFEGSKSVPVSPLYAEDLFYNKGKYVCKCDKISEAKLS